MDDGYEPRVTHRRPISEDVLELQEHPSYHRNDRLPDLPPSMPEFSRGRGPFKKEPSKWFRTLGNLYCKKRAAEFFLLDIYKAPKRFYNKRLYRLYSVRTLSGAPLVGLFLETRYKSPRSSFRNGAK